MKKLRHLALCAAALAALSVLAQTSSKTASKTSTTTYPPIAHPHSQPMLAASTETTTGDVTTVSTGESLFPPSFPFLDPPGSNLLPTVYTNVFDTNGDEIPNTLPSTPTVPYNLHDGAPVVSKINETSPTDDLTALFTQVPLRARKSDRDEFDEDKARRAIQLGIDILEGNPIPNRAYSGIPLLHYIGPLKQKKVQPIYDEDDQLVGGNVDVHQVWYDNHIESDTYLLDPTAVLNVPWTITYTVDVLSRGEDDFSPFTMYFSAPGSGKPGVAMDQSFFPMQDGTRTVFKIKMAPAGYFKLTYTWGWRWHPPRIQVIENATNVVNGMTLVEWETSVFGEDPRASEEAKLQAIGKIGDLAPAKRMWQALREARDAAAADQWEEAALAVEKGHRAFFDWRDRTQLPEGVELDETADLTLFYVNNTIYGQFTAGTLTNFPDWQTRGTTVKVALINGDYFDHAYQNVDFGGARGWENQYKSSVKVGGSGCWFTFGRVWWWMNLPQIVTIPAATADGDLGRHRVEITYNYDPSRRLRFYQFDPTHHDVAIFSVH